MPPSRGAITITSLVYAAPNGPISDLPAGDAYAAALQAGCEALLEFQVIEASLTGDPVLSEQLARAIVALRSALFHLRISRVPQSSALTFGFVIGSEPGRLR